MARNPGKVLLALLVLGQSFAAFTISAQPHLLSIQSAWADLTSTDETKYVREVVEAPEEPAVIMERIAKCESGGKHFDSQGRLMKHVNNDGSVDYGKFMINDKRHEHKAVDLKMNIYTEEGNTAYAYHLYETEGTEPWIWTKPCWVNAK